MSEDDRDTIFRDDWVSMVQSNMKMADLALHAGEWSHAYHHAGVAVECALKARIMSVRGLNRWPTKREDNAINVHKLESLARQCDIRGLLEDMERNQDMPDLLGAWMIAKDWFNEVKYRSRFPEKLAENMVHACDEGGLIEWILK
ncbi:hypothetical protein HW537_10985 [Asaia siamensis]